MLGTTNTDRQTARRQVTRQETRREILDAAWEIARERGLTELTLREVAGRVGMRAPSLYTHFDSKLAIYDAMFADAWDECHAAMRATAQAQLTAASTGRETLQVIARAFFDFSVSDLPRHQLMDVAIIPGFRPTEASYSPAVAVLEDLRERMAAYGVTAPADLDLFTAVVGGLIDSQLANDPGGDRYARLLPRAVDLIADDLDL